MIPSLFLAVTHFPLGPVGKTDRKVLGQRAQAYVKEVWAEDERVSDTTGSPNTAAEVALAETMATVLDTAYGVISMKTSFYDHGADSLSAIKTVAAL